MLPDYEFLPAPLWLLNILHWLTLTLHFVAMNFVLGGGLILLFARIRNKWDDPVVQRFISLFPVLLAATVTLGIAPLLFLQLTYYGPVYSAAVVSAWPFLMIIAAVILAYYLFYGAFYSKLSRYGMLIGLAIVGMLYVSFVYSATFDLAERPEEIGLAYRANQSGFYIYQGLGNYIFRWLHMVAGAVTVGGFFVGLIGRRSEGMFKLGKRTFLYGMILTMLIGLVYIATLGEALLPYMRSAGIWMVLVAIVLSLGGLHFYFRKQFLWAALLTFVSMFSMVINRHVLRLVLLEGQWDPSAIPVNPQWGVFAVFLVCFLLALGLVGYMLWLFFTDRRQPA